ncbi:hypothetical protein ACLB2K_064054 [Fragaria x ananassa]
MTRFSWATTKPPRQSNTDLQHIHASFIVSLHDSLLPLNPPAPQRSFGSDPSHTDEARSQRRRLLFRFVTPEITHRQGPHDHRGEGRFRRPNAGVCAAHPLIKHWVSVLRNEQTPCPIFRNVMAELGRLLIYEASRDWLPTVTGEILSPMGVASVEFIDPREPVSVIPILRAGLALMEHASSVLPATKTYHLDEETLLPTVYLNKLPEKFPEGSRVFLFDPMLATGGTIVAAVDLLKEHGLANKQIKVVSIVMGFLMLHVYTGIIDPTVNDKGFIIPGLGDTGDRSFGKVSSFAQFGTESIGNQIQTLISPGNVLSSSSPVQVTLEYGPEGGSLVGLMVKSI